MSRVHWSGRWEPFRDFHREMGRFFENLEPLQPWSRRVPRPFPALNLYDAVDAFIVTVELPGMSSEDFELSITGETLTMRGERRRAERIPEESYRRQERLFGRWTRTISLPEPIQSQAVIAEYHNGVLTIRLPKSEEIKPTQIVVSSAKE